jgi:signal peptidase II
MDSKNWIGGRRLIGYALWLVLNYGLDRLGKLLALRFLVGRPAQGFFANLLVIVYAENDGAFLGLGGEWPAALKLIVLIILPLAACLAGGIYAFRRDTPWPTAVCVLAMIGGGLGNLRDRILNDGLVVDYLNFGIGGLRTGILNIGDLSVTFGAVGLLIYEFRRGGEKT